MSKTRKNLRSGGGRQRRISVRAVRRDPPDLRKLSRALIQLAIAQADAEVQAAAEHAAQIDKANHASDAEASHD
jgi:hypothetical protein